MPQTVIVLGGGIIGLSNAFEAACRGMEVTLIEPGKLGGQASGAAAGMLAPFSENTEQPDDFFHLCLSSLRSYPSWIERVEELSGISTEWKQSGSINVFMHEADELPILSRLQWQNEWGADAQLIDCNQLRKLEPMLAHSAISGVFMPHESHVYAPKLVEALEAACRRIGVRLLDHAGEIEQVVVQANGGVSIRARAVEGVIHGDRLVVSAGAWTGSYENWFGLSIPIHPIRGQICAYQHKPNEVNHMIFSSQAYWVGKENNRLVCGASEDVAGFDTRVTERGIGRLIRSSNRLFPYLEKMETVHRWAGLRPATRDGLPLLGMLNANPSVIIAAGHYRNGILLSPITAAIVADLLEGKANQSKIAAFAPNRFMAGG